mmetsp:Transcript_40021/g.125248  ORF Transcript_40021/g.125248 Transcript_40021/m.125248 type:complete len:245 (-) Transcript_40021:204-938(-)
MAAFAQDGGDADLVAQKKAMRSAIKEAFAGLSAEDIAEQSARAVSRVLAIEEVQSARGVCAYLSMPKELQTGQLLEGLFGSRYTEGATMDDVEADADLRLVCVPKVTGRDRHDMCMVPVLGGTAEIDGFPKNKWKIPEPAVNPDAPLERLAPLLDVVLIPGVAFDASCNRLGHGKGYYDTFLEGLTAAREAAGLPPPTLIGLGLGIQVLDAVPMDAHDRQLDRVVTPDAVYLRDSEHAGGRDTL